MRWGRIWAATALVKIQKDLGAVGYGAAVDGTGPRSSSGLWAPLSLLPFLPSLFLLFFFLFLLFFLPSPVPSPPSFSVAPPPPPPSLCHTCRVISRSQSLSGPSYYQLCLPLSSFLSALTSFFSYLHSPKLAAGFLRTCIWSMIAQIPTRNDLFARKPRAIWQ